MLECEIAASEHKNLGDDLCSGSTGDADGDDKEFARISRDARIGQQSLSSPVANIGRRRLARSLGAHARARLTPACSCHSPCNLATASADRSNLRLNTWIPIGTPERYLCHWVAAPSTSAQSCQHRGSRHQSLEAIAGKFTPGCACHAPANPLPLPSTGTFHLVWIVLFLSQAVLHCL